MAINRSVTNQQTFLKRKGWPQFSACCQREKGKMTEISHQLPSWQKTAPNCPRHGPDNFISQRQIQVLGSLFPVPPAGLHVAFQSTLVCQFLSHFASHTVILFRWCTEQICIGNATPPPPHRLSLLYDLQYQFSIPSFSLRHFVLSSPPPAFSLPVRKAGKWLAPQYSTASVWYWSKEKRNALVWLFNPEPRSTHR